jgi:hypothetical protein
VYVLDVIGSLPPERQASAQKIVQTAYGGGMDWKATLRTTLQLGESLDQSLRDLWARNQDIARRTNQTLSAEDFARAIVNENFASLLEQD